VNDPPLFVLGVGRSGTTLLRIMLDRHSALAIPDESFFIPQLADRHRGSLDPEAFLDDLRRLPTIRDWAVPLEELGPRLRPGMPLGAAIAAVYALYAERRGKPRWGDKTPLYMQHLPLLEELFPGAVYVHLIRDGRDVAVSFLSLPRGVPARGWALPRSYADVAAMWRSEIIAARGLGRRAGQGRYLEVRYERLVESPEDELRRICDVLGLGFEPAMLDYVGRAPAAAMVHHRGLARPPTPGLRDWRREMPQGDVESFETVAGDLLRELGYGASFRPTVPGRLRRMSYTARVSTWNAASRGVRRSPLWRRRHPRLV
jgi:hypothetical protein